MIGWFYAAPARTAEISLIAVARVAALEPDPNDPTLTFARLANYLDFDTNVGWRREGRYAEQALRDMPAQQVGV